MAVVTLRTACIILSRISERHAAFNLQPEVFTLPPVSTIPKMNYLQKFLSHKTRAPRSRSCTKVNFTAAIVIHNYAILLPTLRNFTFMHSGFPSQVNYFALYKCDTYILHIFNRERYIRKKIDLIS